MKFLIVGGGGFVGSWLTRELRERGHEIVIIDPFLHFSTHDPKSQKIFDKFKKEELLKGSKIYKKKFEEVGKRVLKKEKPDIVIHLAGIPLEKAKDFDFSLNQLNNDISLTYHVVKAVQEHPVKKFVFMSSIAAYGECEDILTESSPLIASTPYGVTKAVGEFLTMAELHNWNIVRTTNVYGFGDMNMRASNVIINKVLRGEKVIVNNVIAMDFTYVKDLVRGIADVALKAEDKEVFHISGGQARKLLDFVNVLQQHFAVEYELSEEKDRPKRGTMDNTKAKEKLGWTPRTVLETGLLDYLSYVKKYKIA